VTIRTSAWKEAAASRHHSLLQGKRVTCSMVFDLEAQALVDRRESLGIVSREPNLCAVGGVLIGIET
jgi:hypothetical protein